MHMFCFKCTSCDDLKIWRKRNDLFTDLNYSIIVQALGHPSNFLSCEFESC